MCSAVCLQEEGLECPFLVVIGRLVGECCARIGAHMGNHASWRAYFIEDVIQNVLALMVFRYTWLQAQRIPYFHPRSNTEHKG
jgi:hypothetical protein